MNTTSLRLLLLLCLAATFAGCHAAPRAITVPTAATVSAQIGRPALAAKASNATAARLAARAEKAGLAAGSAEARALTLSVAETDQHLTDVLAGKDQLVRQLGSVQIRIDALEKDDAAKTALTVSQAVTIKKVSHRKRIWCGLFLASLVLDYFCGAFVEARLRGVVAVAHGLFATGYHLAAGLLKNVFPLYLCWLPA